MAKIPVSGNCDPKFSAIEDAFRRNMQDGDPVCGDELGACVSVVVDGEVVIDLWGGYSDAARTQLWARDTTTCMMSVTKACAAIALLTLIDRGVVEMDAKVSQYWPEFTGGGKESMSVRTLISHQSGVIYADAAPRDHCGTEHRSSARWKLQRLNGSPGPAGPIIPSLMAHFSMA